MSAFKRKLRIVWDNGAPSRYVPRALNPGVDYSWGVFDRKENRFVQDSELRQLADGDLRDMRTLDG